MKPFPRKTILDAMNDSLPANESSSNQLSEVGYMYCPPTHAKALDPETTIVEGIRGAGKSFWWRALHSTEHRRLITSFFPETRIKENLETSHGFGTDSSDDFPDKDIIVKNSEVFAPRNIWRAILASSVGFPPPFPKEGNWSEKFHWVQENPEDYSKLLSKMDLAFANQGKTHVVMFDALDRLANTWKEIRPLARALFQLALDIRSCRYIRIKLFVRPDMLEDKEIGGFPDATKLFASRVPLLWRRVDLYALLYQCLGNSRHGGQAFRAHCSLYLYLEWEKWSRPGKDVWLLPRVLRSNEEMQKEIFHAITGPTMGAGASGHKRGYPYTWLPNHLLDGRNQVSPRSFCAALRRAAEFDHSSPQWVYPLSYKAIQEGVNAASSIRVDEITRDDYPWVDTVMEPLRGRVTVPCAATEIVELWRNEGIVEKLHNLSQKGESFVKLPPQHLEQKEEGILKDLIELGLMQRLLDDRIQMPDVYRLAFGLKRKGGVKPLK